MDGYDSSDVTSVIDDGQGKHTKWFLSDVVHFSEEYSTTIKAWICNYQLCLINGLNAIRITLWTVVSISSWQESLTAPRSCLMKFILMELLYFYAPGDCWILASLLFYIYKGYKDIFYPGANCN